MADITIVTPTVGRKNLRYAIDSMLNQSNPNWQMIVAGDGFMPDIIDDPQLDKRIKVIKAPNFRSAGLMRNFVATSFVDTEWLGFLDDDDELEPNYISEFYRIKEHANPDVILFKMNNYGAIVPSESGDTWIHKNAVRYGNIGMSFCLRSEIMINWTCLFENESQTGSGEDHRMMDMLYTKDFKIWIANYVGYHVRRRPLA